MPSRTYDLAALALCLGLAAPAAAQLGNADERTPDAGNPAVPLHPPGVIAPLSGGGVPPLSGGYLGNPPQVAPPTGRGFLSPPGFLPAPRDALNRPFERGQGSGPGPAPSLPSASVSLPAAGEGRQGLPPQAWAALSARQQDMHREAEAGALGAPLGEGYVWQDGGRSGEVRVTAERMVNNRVCRDFAHAVWLDGRRVAGQSSRCRNPDGTW